MGMFKLMPNLSTPSTQIQKNWKYEKHFENIKNWKYEKHFENIKNWKYEKHFENIKNWKIEKQIGFKKEMWPFCYLFLPKLIAYFFMIFYPFSCFPFPFSFFNFSLYSSSFNLLLLFPYQIFLFILLLLLLHYYHREGNILYSFWQKRHNEKRGFYKNFQIHVIVRWRCEIKLLPWRPLDCFFF
jgi:hypothetical protein